MTKEKKRELEERIENHQIFSLESDKRFADEDLRNEFTLLMMEYMGFPPEWIIPDTDQNTEERRNVALRNNALGQVFDGLAFMEAIKSLLKQDRWKIHSVCAYFQRTYINELKAFRRSEQDRHPKDDLIRNIRKIRDLCEVSGRSLYELTDCEIHTLAPALGISPEKLREELRLYLCTQSVPLIYEHEDGTEETVEIADTTIYGEFGPKELDLIIHILDRVMNTEQREYPRLFWNNILLGLLKDETPENQDSVQKLYQEREKPLMTKVFVSGYLYYVLRQPPDPDTIAHISEADKKLDFIDATIAAYKHVKPPAVSRQRRRFNQILRNLREELQLG